MSARPRWRIAPTPSQLAGFQETLFDRLERRRLECAQPRDNVRLTGDWSKQDFGAVLRASRYGSYCGIDNTVAKDDQTFSAKWLLDVTLSYRLGHVGFEFGVDNIFDTFPDKAIAANNNFGIFTYPRNSPFGFNGRYLYARTSYVF